MQRRLAIFLILALACRGGGTEPWMGRDPTGLRKAPATAILAGQSVSIESYLWRDFQPSHDPNAPTNGQPLIAIVQVRAAGGATLAPEVTADSLWVVWGTQVWSARAIQERSRSETGAHLEVVARNGPKWGPGVHVDVIARLRDGAGNVAFIRAASQMIIRTD